MPELLDRLDRLPTGTHCVSLFASSEEAETQALDFIRGAPADQATAYWVPEPQAADAYNARLAAEASDHVGCVLFLPTEQVEVVEGHLRPVSAVREFVAAHPKGVTAAGATLSYYWAPENVSAHLEYEGWFDNLNHEGSRFLCPYDLRTVPPERAPEILRSLGDHHSHVVLSRSTEPAIRLLQLFVFASAYEIPEALETQLGWAIRRELAYSGHPSGELALTESGDRIVREWSATAIVG